MLVSQAKMDRGEYSSPLEYERDMNLVWDNCMTYNQDGSDFFNIAAEMKKEFQEKFKKVKVDPGKFIAIETAWIEYIHATFLVLPVAADLDTENRYPTLADKKAFSQNIYMISSEDLGKLVQILDSRCESCIKKVSTTVPFYFS